MTDIKRALEVAEIAYNKDIQGDDIIYFHQKNERCCIIIHDDYIEIGAAGSNDLKDWMQNTLILGTKSNGLGRVPRGFYKNIGPLVDKITFHLKPYKERPIRVSGHSRGVPIITFVSYAMWCMGYNIESLTGFGSPKFVKKYGKNQLRATIPNIQMFKNGRDQVTRHPNFGYMSPCKYTEIGPKRNFFTYLFNMDHMIDRYKESVKEYVLQVGK